MSTPLDGFGPGILYATRTDIANATPYEVGSVQEFSTDIAFTLHELYGTKQYPLDVARGTAKVTGKWKTALISGKAWNACFFGNILTPGGYKFNQSEAAVIPATPFQVTPANAATFLVDLGVIYNGGNSVGLALEKVSSLPVTGQYSVSPAGVYTFAAADTLLPVAITYTSSLATGQTLNITSQLIGTSSTFRLDFNTLRNGKFMTVRFNQCIASKFMIASGLDKFMIPEIDVSMFADVVGNVGSYGFSEAS